MKAVRYHSYGDSDVLVHEEADRPVAGAGQVVVRVAGTGLYGRLITAGSESQADVAERITRQVVAHVAEDASETSQI